MKITSTGRKNQVTGINTNKDKVSKVSSFSMAMDFANKDQAEQQLKDMFRNIENIGRRLISTRSVEDAKNYKKRVQEYLSFIVKNVYVLKREPGPFNYGIHVRIEIINEKLDDLAKELLLEQKETIELADKIEEIRGLLVDAYK